MSTTAIWAEQRRGDVLRCVIDISSTSLLQFIPHTSGTVERDHFTPRERYVTPFP